jgi:flagellar biosynthesis protein FlhA
MSEVAARFTLDAMPGRQMAIDADLSTGLINEQQATTRRDDVMREADFYGAMDGASKFVRGDAIAGLFIIMINIVGGLAVGIAMKGWTILETADLFTRLTIGDGLASQIPSFLIAIAAGLIVARAGNRTPLGIEIPKQLVSQPAAIGLVACFLVLLSVTPLPTVPLLVLAGVLGLLSWSSYKQNQVAEEEQVTIVQEQSPSSIVNDSPIQLELGRALLGLASTEMPKNLVSKMSDLRASFLDEFGLVVPSIRIKDNLALPPNSYRLLLKGGVVGEGVVYKDRSMVVAGDEATQDIKGIREKEPIFGYSAIWVTEQVRLGLGDLFVQAMDPVTVIMTHISYIVKNNAAELLSREDVSTMVDELRTSSPHLVADVIGNELSISRLHHILKELLDEQVPLKELSTIIETAADCAELPLEACVEKVRCALRRQICSTLTLNSSEGKPIIRCVELPTQVGQELNNERLTAAVHHAALPLVAEGLPIVVVTSRESRKMMSSKVSDGKDEVVMLSEDEIVPEIDLQIVGKVESTDRRAS